MIASPIPFLLATAVADALVKILYFHLSWKIEQSKARTNEEKL